MNRRIVALSLVSAWGLLRAGAAGAQPCSPEQTDIGGLPCSVAAVPSVLGGLAVGDEWISPFDNPTIVTNLALQDLFYDFNGDGIAEPRQEVVAIDFTGTEITRREFLLQAYTTCDPADVLCRQVYTISGFPDEVGSGIGRFMVPLTRNTTGPQEFRPPSVVENVGLTGLQIGYEPSAVEVIRDSNAAGRLATAATTSVRLDPETLVVAVDVVYVVPHPETPVGSELQSQLQAAISIMGTGVGVSPELDANGVWTIEGGDAFARALFDHTPANDYVRHSLPQPVGLSQEVVTFEYQPLRYAPLAEGGLNPDLKRLDVPFNAHGPSRMVTPDSIWVQCGIQFRLRSVTAIFESELKDLFIDPQQQCPGEQGLAADRDRLAREWGEQAGLPPVTDAPGIRVFFPYRMRSSQCATSESGGTADDGFALIPVDKVGSLTLSHELGHTLGLSSDLEESGPSASRQFCLLNSLEEGDQSHKESSNLMCTVDSSTGFHVSGCDRWRSDGALPTNCVPLAIDDFLIESAVVDCETARGGALRRLLVPNKPPVVSITPTILECYEQVEGQPPGTGGALIRYVADVSDAPDDPQPGFENPAWVPVVSGGPAITPGLETTQVELVTTINGSSVLSARFGVYGVSFEVDESAGPGTLRVAPPDILLNPVMLSGGSDVVIGACEDASAAIVANAPSHSSACPNGQFATLTVTLESGETVFVPIPGPFSLPPGQHTATFVGYDPISPPSEPMVRNVIVMSTPTQLGAAPDIIVQSCDDSFTLTPPLAFNQCGPLSATATDTATGATVDPNAATLPEGVHVIEWRAGVGPDAISVLQNVTVAPCLAAAANIVLGSQSLVLDSSGFFGAVSSAGTVDVHAAAQTGPISAVGTVTVREQALVHGGATSGSLVSIYPPGAVIGPVLSGQPGQAQRALPIASLLDSARFDLVDGTLSVETDVNSLPGFTFIRSVPIYDRIVVAPDTTVTFTSGSYIASEFIVYDGGSVNLDLSDGPVLIAVRDQFFWQGTQHVVPTNPGDFLVLYQGQAPANLESPFQGAVLAPNALLRLAPLNGAGTFTGLFAADRLQLGAGSVLEQRGSLRLFAHVMEPPPSCEGVSSFPAVDMFHSTGGPADVGWNIWSNGYISTQHEFASVPTLITVVARGEEAQGELARMSVTVGGETIGETPVASGEFRSYSFAYIPSAGSQEVRVSFLNDFYSPSEDRNLIVEAVIVSCGDGLVNSQMVELDVDASVDADWGSGYCVNFSVTNPSTRSVSDWALSFWTGDSTLTQWWNSTVDTTTGLVTADPFEWNATIPPGGTVEGLGFCASRESPGVLPSGIEAMGMLETPL